MSTTGAISPRAWPRLAERLPATASVGLAAAVFAAAAAISRPRSWGQPVTSDGGQFIYMGQTILEGETPYVDASNNKGPVLFFLFALIRLVSGTSSVAVRLTLLAFTVLAALALAAYVARFAGRATGFACGLIFAVIAAGPTIRGSEPFSEQYGVAPMMGAWWLATREGWASQAGAGVLTAAAVLMNPSFVIVVPFVLYELWRSGGRPDAGRRVGVAGAGALAVAAPIFVWLGLAGALDDMGVQMLGQVEDAIGGVAPIIGITQAAVAPIARLDLPGLLAFPNQRLTAVGVVGCLLAMRDPRLRPVAIPVLLWIVASVLRVTLPNFTHPWNAFLATPGIAAGIGLGVASLWRGRVDLRVAAAVAVVGLAAWSPLVTPQLSGYEVRPHAPVVEEVGAFIRERTTPDETMQIVGYAPELYWLADRRAPSRHFAGELAGNPEYQVELAEDLRRDPPDAIAALPETEEAADSPFAFLLRDLPYRLAYEAGGVRVLLLDQSDGEP